MSASPSKLCLPAINLIFCPYPVELGNSTSDSSSCRCQDNLKRLPNAMQISFSMQIFLFTRSKQSPASKGGANSVAGDSAETR